MTDYFILQPAQFKLDGGAMYGIIPKPLWEKGSPADSQNRIELALRLMLIKQQNRIILIDTGIGDYHHDKFNQNFDIRSDKNPLVQCLETIGVYPADITDIILSHLHFDHIGGLGIEIGGKQTPLFPQAVLHIHKEHFAYAQNPTERDSGSFQSSTFLPLIAHYREHNLLNWIEGNQGNIFDDGSLKFISSKGHTPFMIHPYDDKFLYAADIIPTSHHIKPAWVMGYDMAPGVSVKNKQEILALALQKDLTLVFEHDPEFWGAKITQDSKERIVIKQRNEAPAENASLLKL